MAYKVKKDDIDPGDLNKLAESGKVLANTEEDLLLSEVPEDMIEDAVEVQSMNEPLEEEEIDEGSIPVQE